MAEKLTDRLVKTATTPDKGFRLIWIRMFEVSAFASRQRARAHSS